MTKENNDQYPENYRHFDSLIWQLPALSTAIFALAMTAAATGLADDPTTPTRLENIPDIDIARSVGFLLALTSFVIVLLTFVFTRLRLHQDVSSRLDHDHIPQRWYLPSGQRCLLAILVIEIGCLAAFAAVLGGYLPVCAFLPTLALGILVLYIFFEYVFHIERIRTRKKLFPKKDDINQHQT